MGIKTQEKSLIPVEKDSIFDKIKKFLVNIFHKNRKIDAVEDIPIQKQDEKNQFIEYIKTIEDEETKLLKLQKQYRNGEIKEDKLTKEQVNALCSLYDKQIADLRKSNKIRKQKLVEYRKKLQSNN